MIDRRPSRLPSRRALTLLELLLALTVTAMVGAGIASMLGVVTTGVSTHRDNRAVMIRAHAAQSRLGAYLGRARCVLDLDPGGDDIVLWLEDARKSGTVHATEVRWLLYDAAGGSIEVYFVRFPETWTRAACDLADKEYPPNANWASVLAHYETAGHLGSIRLIDGLASVAADLDAVDPLDARMVTYVLGFQTTDGTDDVPVAAAIRHHQEPVSP